MKAAKHPLRKSKDETPTAESPAVRADVGAMREQIQALAYRLWLERGCPIGSPQVDWLRAEDEMRNGHSREELSAARALATKSAGM